MYGPFPYRTDKIKLIINRYNENEEITIDDVEDALGHEVYWKIPNNYFSVMSAINKGVPISSIAPNSDIDLSFTDLAGKLSDSVIINHSSKKSGSKGFKLPFNLDINSLKNLKLFNK